jgi:hypothetical protein
MKTISEKELVEMETELLMIIMKCEKSLNKIRDIRKYPSIDEKDIKKQKL